jgi:hypothetical protein
MYIERNQDPLSVALRHSGRRRMEKRAREWSDSRLGKRLACTQLEQSFPSDSSPSFPPITPPPPSSPQSASHSRPSTPHSHLCQLPRRSNPSPSPKEQPTPCLPHSTRVSPSSVPASLYASAIQTTRRRRTPKTTPRIPTSIQTATARRQRSTSCRIIM